MGVRRIWSLVRHLPPGNALDRALDPDGYGVGWRTGEELQAQTLEVTHALYRAFLAVNFKGTPPKQLRIPRPGEHRKERRMATPEELFEWITSVGAAPLGDPGSN